MEIIYREFASCEYKVKFQSKQFKWGREPIENDLHTEQSVTPEMCKKIIRIIYIVRKVSNCFQDVCRNRLFSRYSFTYMSWIFANFSARWVLQLHGTLDCCNKLNLN